MYQKGSPNDFLKVLLKANNSNSNPFQKNAIKYIEFEYSKNDTRMTSILVQR